MTAIYKYLEEKNYWYEKYLSCTEAFLAAIRHAPDLALDELELFYGNRDSLLKILANLDSKLQGILDEEETRKAKFSSEQSTKVQYFLREKDAIVGKIVALDKELMAEIECLRTKSEEKLKSLAKGKKALAKYKSGETANERLDKRV